MRRFGCLADSQPQGAAIRFGVGGAFCGEMITWWARGGVDRKRLDRRRLDRRRFDCRRLDSRTFDISFESCSASAIRAHAQVQGDLQRVQRTSIVMDPEAAAEYAPLKQVCSCSQVQHAEIHTHPCESKFQYMVQLQVPNPGTNLVRHLAPIL